jgi:hypothetical protein
MSILEDINARVQEGRLFYLVPALPSDPVVRYVFVSKEINGLVIGPWQDAKLEYRGGQLRAYLERFITGQLIGVAKEPYHARTAYMAQLSPLREEVWEIRSRDPRPAIRVFGRFAQQDTFVALTWAYRKPLGGPNSHEWRDAIEITKAEWRKLFPTYDPFSGTTVNDYITDNVFLV